MFGLFKRNFAQIDPANYQMLAVSASTTALTMTTMLLSHTSDREETFLNLLYNDTLALAVCLAQMSIQKKYKLEHGNDVLHVIRELQQQFRQIPATRTVFDGQEVLITRQMLDDATTEDFFEKVAILSARDYKSFWITEEDIEFFCKITGQIPSIIRGAGWTMALLMFQIKASRYVFKEPQAKDELLPFLEKTRDGCRFMMEKLERALT